MDPDTGRTNQKRRTRAAVVAAAEELLAQGITPTVAQAAELALVSRTTAYRYFPTQESLLLELSVTTDVAEIEAFVAEPADAAAAADRVLELVDRFDRHVQDAEVRYRTTLRLYLDQWLAAVADGEVRPVVREGRRTRWLETLLAPLAGTVPQEDLDRLVAALSLVIGAEPVVVLHDVCQLQGDEARAVATWAAGVLVEATLRGQAPLDRT